MRLEILVSDLLWVSPAREHELSQVLSVFNELLNESEYKDFVPSNVDEVFKELIKQECVLSLREENGRIVGLLAYTLHENPYILFKKKFAQELVWCVLKPYRKHSKMLVAYLEQVAKEKGCTSVMLGAMYSSKSKVINRLYKSMGYNKFEEIFEKGIN